MQQIEISDLQSQIGVLLKAISQGEEIILTEARRPFAKVVQFSPVKKRRKAGSAAGQIIMSSDFDEPLEDFKEYME